MKSKLSLLITLTLLAVTTATFARNDAPANDSTANATAAPAASADNSTAANTATADASKTPAAEAPKDTTANSAPAAEAPATNSKVVAQADTQPAAANNPPATPAPATPTTANSSAPVIPLIVMDDVPLTDAIKNLARQAGLNYMLDPKIGYGQPGPDGRPTPQPSVSIRWENVTAEQALNALLNNYSLQLVEDTKTHIARVTIKDPAAPDPLVTKIIQLKYAPATNIITSVQTALTDKRSRVVADIRTSQLVVVATE